jgi:hypothetical protein
MANHMDVSKKYYYPNFYISHYIHHTPPTLHHLNMIRWLIPKYNFSNPKIEKLIHFIDFIINRLSLHLRCCPGQSFELFMVK